MTRPVLVTGADGFIGSHLVETLVRQGRSVRAFCCYNSFNSWGWLDTVEKDVRAGLDVVLGDVRDRHCVEEAMRGCGSVLHLAALIAIPFSYRAAESFVDVNVKGTLNVLEAARRLSVDRVVQTSTSETYGSAQFVPMTEEHPLSAQSPYAATKIAADQMALSYWRSFGLPVAVVRPFNTFGPRQSLRAVIPTILTQLLDGAPTLHLGALDPRRDFTFVGDTVAGMIAVHDHPAAIGQVINIGSGHDVSIGDLARLCMAVTGREAELKQETARLRPVDSEVDRLLCGNEKALSLLGWRPTLVGEAGLQEGLSRFADWLRNPDNRARYVNVDRYVV